jgi:hypothetical protein
VASPTANVDRDGKPVATFEVVRGYLPDGRTRQNEFAFGDVERDVRNSEDIAGGRR